MSFGVGAQSIYLESLRGFFGKETLVVALEGIVWIEACREIMPLWYKHLQTFLLHHKFNYDQTLPCLFTLKQSTGFVVIVVYVDDLNLVRTTAICKYAKKLLTDQFAR